MIFFSQTNEHLAQILWDYLGAVAQEPDPADVIIVFGCSDLTVADRSALLWKKGVAPYLLCTGSFGKNTTHFHKYECEVFADRAAAHGVAREQIILENRSTNTSDNIRFSSDVLLQKYPEKSFKKIIAVTKPFAARRLLATFNKISPELVVTVATPTASMECYAREVLPFPQLLQSLVGAVNRLLTYPKRGFIDAQALPEYVINSYEELRLRGFTVEIVAD